MKKSWLMKIISILLCITLILPANLIVFAENAEPQRLFSDDFESSFAGDWQFEASANAEIVDDGSGNQVMSLRPVDGEWGSSAQVHQGDLSWQDYSVEAELTLNEWLDTGSWLDEYSTISIGGRTSGDPQQRWELMYRKSGKLELNKFCDNGGNEIDSTPFTMDPGQAYKFRMEFEGANVRAYFAPKGSEYGEPLFSYEDTGAAGTIINGGGITVSSCGAHTNFDNVEVFEIIGETDPGENPDPGEKPEPGDGNVLFFDDFESGSPRSEWGIPSASIAEVIEDENGNKLLSLQPKAGEWGSNLNLNFNKAEWRNYYVEMNFSIVEWIDHGTWLAPYDNIGVAGRYNSGPEQRWEVMYRKAGNLELNKFQNNSGNAVLTKPYTLEAGKQYRMKIDFDGSTIRGYFAEENQEYGEPAFEYEDNGSVGTPIESGGVCISSCGAHTYFDNIKVVGIEDNFEMESLELNKEAVELEAGTGESLSTYIAPDNTTNRGITWTSSDASVASVTNTGFVMANKAGTATITATAEESDTLTASCEITVYENSTCGTFYYVATDGNDNNNGSEAAPFATLERARDAIRSLSSIPEGGVTVYLRGGLYYRTQVFELTPQDSGRKGSPIVYASYPGEKATITSGERITGWKKAAADTENIAEAAVGNVYVADIEKGWRFHDLYVDGVRQATSSNYDDQDWLLWPKMTYRPTSPDGQKLIFRDGELDGLAGQDIELNLMAAWWWNNLPVVKDINEAENSAILHSKNTCYPNGEFLHGEYSILNAFRYLDVPGEWCIDSTKGKVYYWPLDGIDMENSQIIAPHLYELIRMQGDEEAEGWANQVEYVTLDNLVLEYNDRMPEDQWPDEWMGRNSENPDAVIFMQGVYNCKVTNSVVRHTGSYAVALDHWAQENIISGNDFGDLGCGGIQMYGYGVGTVDVHHNNKVFSNYIHEIGRSPYSHSAGISVFGSGYNSIAYNYLRDLPYAAVAIMGTDNESMSASTPNSMVFFDTYGDDTRHYKIRFDELGGRDFTRWEAKEFQHSEKNIVQYNITEDYMMEMDDGGSLYAWNSGLDNEFNFNLVKKLFTGKTTWPLYMDGNADGFKLEGNLVWGILGGIHDKSEEPHKNRYINTILTDDEPTGYRDLEAKILEVTSYVSYGENDYQEAPEPEVDKAVQAVIEKINAIGKVGTGSKAAIEAARNAYNKLTGQQKEQVSNYNVLTKAETDYAKIVKDQDDAKKAAEEAAKKAAAEKKAIQDVITKIDAIGTVSLSTTSKAKIDAARKAYNALTADQKKKVTNYSKLTSAESKYAELDKNKLVEGKTYTVGSYRYKISDLKGKKVTVTGVKNKKIKTISVKDTVKIKGTKFKVTAIGDGAFKNCKKSTKATIGKYVQKIGKSAFYKCSKLKTIKVKTKKLTKVGQKALTGINANAKIKVPKGKVNRYNKLFKGKGQKKTVKVVRS